jgi:hypothetical protein
MMSEAKEASKHVKTDWERIDLVGPLNYKDKRGLIKIILILEDAGGKERKVEGFFALRQWSDKLCMELLAKNVHRVAWVRKHIMKQNRKCSVCNFDINSAWDYSIMVTVLNAEWKSKGYMEWTLSAKKVCKNPKCHKKYYKELAHDDTRAVICNNPGCISIGEGGKGLGRCSQCKRMIYCSLECQKEDWEMGHKNDCQRCI